MAIVGFVLQGGYEVGDVAKEGGMLEEVEVEVGDVALPVFLGEGSVEDGLVK